MACVAITRDLALARGPRPLPFPLPGPAKGLLKSSSGQFPVLPGLHSAIRSPFIIGHVRTERQLRLLTSLR